MKTKQLSMLVASVLACTLWGSAHAAEFDVGRATVVFPTEDWRETALPDEGLAYSGHKSGALSSETKLFVKESSERGIEAVVLLRGSKGGLPGSLMTYSRQCKGDDKFFAEGTTGEKLRVAHCLRVFPRYTMSSLLESLGKDVQEAMKDAQSKLPESAYYIDSTYSNSNGSSLRAYALLAPGFKGRPGSVDVAFPKGIEASHVVWGRELNSAVRGSVTSIFGKMEFPALNFDAPDGPKDTALTSSQAQ